MAGPQRVAFAEAQLALRAIIAARPPRELPGCASCPSRCLMLTAVASAPSQTAQTVAARVSMTTALPTRVRSLASISDPVAESIEAQIGGPIDRLAFAHCLITTSCAASTDADPAEVLAALPLIGSPQP